MMVPDAAVRFGFVNNPVGPHASRTMLLANLRTLLIVGLFIAAGQNLKRLLRAAGWERRP